MYNKTIYQHHDQYSTNLKKNKKTNDHDDIHRLKTSTEMLNDARRLHDKK